MCICCTKFINFALSETTTMGKEKVIEKILNWFYSTRPASADVFDHKPGAAFGVSGGRYLGEFFVYMEQTENDMCFLSLPKMKIRNVPKEKFKIGIESNVLEFQEILPKHVQKICIEQYNKNAKKSNS